MESLSRVSLSLLFAGALALPAGAQVKPASSIYTKDAFLAGVHIVGATGVFRTDVTIFNPAQTDVTVDLYFTPADTNGSQLPGLSIKNGLHPRESVTLVDVVGDPLYFNRSSAYGVLNVRGSSPLIVTSNTYNVAGAVAGTYGQFSPGQPIEDALGFDDSDTGDLYLPGLPFDANHRVNAVVINPTGIELEAGVQLVDAVGQIYGTGATGTSPLIVKVPPFSLHQINDIFGAAFASSRPPQNGAPYRLNVYVNVGNGAKVLTYATVTDTRTGDPYLIPGLAQFR